MGQSRPEAFARRSAQRLTPGLHRTDIFRPRPPGQLSSTFALFGGPELPIFRSLCRLDPDFLRTLVIGTRKPRALVRGLLKLVA